MCLHTVDKETKQVTEGWKVFEIADKKLYGSWQPYTFKTNKWIEDTNNIYIRSATNTKYRAGFHFFLNKKDAYNAVGYKYEIVQKIKVRSITATGLQNKCKVGVARKIFIEEE